MFAQHNMLAISLLTLSYLASSGDAAAAASNGFNFVHPLIGTLNGGHVFPGATLPFGMAKAVADCTGEIQGGFASDGSNITGFSHMHDSGTGGSPSLGNFPIFPQPGCPGDNYMNCKYTQTDRQIARINGSASANPGYFTVSLASGIKGEITVTNHTALYRFAFPTSTPTNESLSPLMLVDLIDLPQSRSYGSAQVDPHTGRITANGTFNPSFGVGSYNSYVCVDFVGASIKQAGTFSGSTPSNSTYSVTSESLSNPAGAWVQFNKPSNGQMLARAGVSLISTAKACQNAESEIPLQGATFNFQQVLTAAQNVWKDKLSVVSLDATGVDNSFQITFWSGIYRSMISPQDYTGENPLWTSSEPYYDSYYCIWDSFRSIHQLITLLDPTSQALMIRSLIDIYRHEGHLPDCRMSLCKGYTQGGSNADIVLTDSYLKQINSGIDWATGYEALIADAEIEPSNWGVNGRGSLNHYHSEGYVPTDDTDHSGVGPFTRSISRTVEYAYDDFCIAEMAKAMGKTSDYNKYLNRSGNWLNMYNANQTSVVNGQDPGFQGFLQPKYINQTWGYQDPTLCSPLNDFTGCYLNPTGHETYEGSCWLYTFFVPGDMATLISTLGGNQRFVDRLDFLHESGLLYVGDEQAFLTLYQYHYAGRPGRSAYRAHSYIPSQFNDTVVGIAGNDDSGAMGSFIALTMMGIFPNPGQDVYFITPPFFPSVSIRSGQTGKTATIKNINFDAAYKNIYIQSATVNGQPYTKNYLQHEFFLSGGTLELTLGSTESSWGTQPQDVPPSNGPYH